HPTALPPAALPCSLHPLAPPSFPTRRSSDLRRPADRCPVLDRPAATPSIRRRRHRQRRARVPRPRGDPVSHVGGAPPRETGSPRDRKSTRLNSSHLGISYAVFCLKKKKKIKQ